jgi:general secretion pathway protein H
MLRQPPPHCRFRAQEQSPACGFTLIEVIAVMVILALVAGLVMTHGRVRSTRIDMEVAQRALTASLRLARGRAIATDQIVTMHTNAAGFALDGGPFQPLPAGLTLTPATISFMPDGISSGGVIVVASPSGGQRIGVNWINGRISSTPLSANP